MDQPKNVVAAISRRRALLYACATVVAPAPCISYGAAETGFPLWQIKSDGGLVYLLGHTPPRQADGKDARIQGLLPHCGGLWNETNRTLRTSKQELIRKYGIDTTQALRLRLNSSDRVRLSAAAKMLEVSEESLDPFRPWLAGQVLEEAFFNASSRRAGSGVGNSRRERISSTRGRGPLVQPPARRG